MLGRFERSAKDGDATDFCGWRVQPLVTTKDARMMHAVTRECRNIEPTTFTVLNRKGMLGFTLDADSIYAVATLLAAAYKKKHDMSSRIRDFAIAMLLGGVLATQAMAMPIVLAAQGTVLFRVDQDDVEFFDVEHEPFAMVFDEDSKRVIGAARGRSGAVHLFELKDPTGDSPELKSLATLDHFYGSMTKAGEYLYGFQGGSSGNLYLIDISHPDDPTEVLVGSTGVSDPGGCAYDPETDVIYLVSLATTSLYAVDPDTAASEVIGDTGLAPLGLGMELWKGHLLIAVQNEESFEYEIGELDKFTGEYTLLFGLGVPPQFQATSLALIPHHNAIEED